MNYQNPQRLLFDLERLVSGWQGQKSEKYINNDFNLYLYKNLYFYADFRDRYNQVAVWKPNFISKIGSRIFYAA